MGRVNTREMQLTIWESVVSLDQIPFGSQSKSWGRQFRQSEPWGGSSKVGVTGLGSACWPRLLHAIDQEALPGVCCLPDAQRIAASRPFHGAGGDALLGLGLLLHAPAAGAHRTPPSPPWVVWGLGMGWVELEYPVLALQPLSPLPRAGTQAQTLASNAPSYFVCPPPNN